MAQLLSLGLLVFLCAFAARYLFEHLYVVLILSTLLLSTIITGFIFCLGSIYWLSRSREARRASISPRETNARLHFSTPAAWARTLTQYEWAESNALHGEKQILHPSFDKATNAAVDELLDLLIKNFVLSWYLPLISQQVSRTFPAAVEHIIRQCLAALLQRADKLDWPNLMVARILPKITTHIQNFKEAGGLGVADSDMDLALAARYASLLPGGKLHEAVNVNSLTTRPTEEKWLRGKVGGILQLIMPRSSAASS
jgi:sorting nexin-25